VITVLSLLVWGGKNGMPGVWGVLLGAGISGTFVLLTVLGILFTARTSPSVTLAVVLGGLAVEDCGANWRLGRY